MFIYLDTETTGTDEGDRLCQIAFKTKTGLIVNELFNPGKSISISITSSNFEYWQEIWIITGWANDKGE
jgi:DNA polymerase III epsilon subunit-like protein